MNDEPQLHPVIEWRCPRCNSLLMKVRLAPGVWIQIKCRRCNHLTERQMKRTA